MKSLDTLAPDALSLLTLACLADRVFKITGDARAKAAAAMCRAKPGGRPMIDDAAPLAELDFLLVTGRELSVEAAARSVAPTLRGHQSIDSATRRLARKYRRLARIKQLNPSPPPPESGSVALPTSARPE
jgi:hypothetical protein